MILRTVEPRVPRRGDKIDWVAVQIEDTTDGEDWRVVQAHQVERGARTMHITGRFRPGATQWRAVWVPDGGSKSGLSISDPKRF